MGILQQEILDLNTEVAAEDQAKMNPARKWLVDLMGKDADIFFRLADLMGGLVERIDSGNTIKLENLREILGAIVYENQRLSKEDGKVDISGEFDDALRMMMKYVCQRLREDPVVKDPTSPDKVLADDKSGLINSLCDCLEKALNELEALEDKECAKTKVRALEAWCKAFPIPFLCDLLKKCKSNTANKIRAGIIGPAIVPGTSGARVPPLSAGDAGE